MGEHKLVFLKRKYCGEKIKTLRKNVRYEKPLRYCYEHEPALVAVEFLRNGHDEDLSLAEEDKDAYFDKLQNLKRKNRNTAKKHWGVGLMAEVKIQKSPFFFTKSRLRQRGNVTQKLL